MIAGITSFLQIMFQCRSIVTYGIDFVLLGDQRSLFIIAFIGLLHMAHLCGDFLLY